MDTSTVKAFVIGPIGDKDADDGSDSRIAYEEGVQILEEVICPACAAFGVAVLRADTITRTGEIPEQIFRLLRDSALVIADLTGANPNVMYELGLRHTTGKLTIQIGERDRLPFDVAAIRTIKFKRTEAGLVQARKELSKSLAENLDSGGDPVTATRIWFEPTAQFESVDLRTSDADPDVVETDEAPGFLELLAEMEMGLQSLSQTIANATSVTEDIGRIYTETAAKMRDSDGRGGGASGRLVIANRTAALLEDPVSRMQVVVGEYENTVARVEPGLSYMLHRLASEPEQLAEAPDFPMQLRGLVEAANANIPGALTMSQNSLDIGKAARSLRAVGRRLASSFTKFSKVSKRVADWEKWLDGLPSDTKQ